MFNSTNLKTVFVIVSVALLGGLATTSNIGAQTGAKTSIIVITVRLPDDAVLLIENNKMKATGGVRVFQTSPLTEGYQYAYTLKALSQGKEVTRVIQISHGADNSFDLRAEFLQGAMATEPSQKMPLAAASQKRPNYFPLINWGADLRTVEKALDPHPADGSRFPK
jgi:uncharacterized protein (TIGR03000 family)